MIFKSLTPREKKKYNRNILGFGILMLILGIIPGLLPIWAGLILFIFSIIVVGIIVTVVSEPDPADFAMHNEHPEEQSHSEIK